MMHSYHVLLYCLIFFGTDLPHDSLVLRLDYQPLLEIEPSTLLKLDNV